MRDKTIVVYLHESEYEKIKKFAREKSLSTSAFVRSLIMSNLIEVEKEQNKTGG